MHRLANAARVARTRPEAATPVGRALNRLDALGAARRTGEGAVAADGLRRSCAPDSELTAELRSRFKPEVVALGEHLGRDLVGLWGYDRVE